MDLSTFMKRTTRWMRSYSISSVNGSYTTSYHGSLATSAFTQAEISRIITQYLTPEERIFQVGSMVFSKCENTCCRCLLFAKCLYFVLK